MLKIEIRDIKYTVRFFDDNEQDAFDEKGELKLLGQADHIKQEIKIYRHLKEDTMLRTIIHELSPCFMRVYLENDNLKDTFNGEDIACFVSAYADEIINRARYIRFELRNEGFIEEID